MTVIFVGGIHGVGKSSLCAEVEASLGVAHHTASRIIKSAVHGALACKTKVVENMNDNQRLLIDGFRESRKSATHILLDGHWTLQTSKGFEPIPVGVFRHLQINAGILVVDDGQAISDRAMKRDGRSLSVAELTLHQSIELAHAQLVTKTLDLPLTILHSPTSASFLAAVQVLL